MRYNNFVIHFHSPKVTFLFCFFKSNRLIRITVPSTVLLYLIQIFAIAVNICRAYLKHGGNETETMLLIQKYLTPVRYNRNYPIHLRPKRNRDFMYRIA
ncbi:hypothetical protein DW745_07930 [Ruminococcus sp. AM28-29LB]|nr:hypothetical protein DW745_07930 [Ruminococcus sp. AM28-29LB]